MKKKDLKILGNIISIAAIIGVLYKICRLNVDYSALYNKKNLIILIVLAFLYSLNLLVNPIIWRQIIYSLTEKKVNLNVVEYIYCRSNLLKYLPGNVFQYIGRNAIAIKEDLSHVDVALSTCIDIICNLLGVFGFAIICYSHGLLLWLQEWGKEECLKIIFVGIVGVLLISIILLIGKYIFPLWFDCLVNRLKRILTFQNLLIYLGCIIAYFAMAGYTSEIYILVMQILLKVEIYRELWLLLSGVYLFSWIVGFITPGAPGGIGVREFVVMLFLNNSPLLNNALLGMVIYRLVTIIGDVLAFLWGWLILSKFSWVWKWSNSEKQ